MRGALHRSLAALAVALAVALTIPISEAMWGKILHVHGSVAVGGRTAGTIGFWKNWDRHQTFSQSEIEGWLVEIDDASQWLGPTTVEEMAAHFDAAVGGGASMQSRFLGHYLATRLNERAGMLDGLHDVSLLDPGNYLGLVDPHFASLGEIFNAVEAKYATGPTGQEYEILKNIADALNNLEV